MYFLKQKISVFSLSSISLYLITFQFISHENSDLTDCQPQSVGIYLFIFTFIYNRKRLCKVIITHYYINRLFMDVIELFIYGCHWVKIYVNILLLTVSCLK